MGKHHIGSTSVQTVGYTKPIIDILLVVKNIEQVDIYNEKLKTLGYEPRGENGIIGRRYFPKGNEKRTHHLHIFQRGNENIKTYLNFKEYLINHPQDAQDYGELKIKLASLYPDDIHKYQLDKEHFVNELVLKAKKWAAGD
ncbi:GrpB family protein [Neobacillus drentensis]|uniref:GrpB family protein n=1 Tax=Neobacillus drentensis TaxID=220684 RepID=UPI002FFD9BB7